MLIGVPTDVNHVALQVKMQGKMEEIRQRMIARSPSKYGTIVRFPQFVFKRDYIKNMPYAERSDNNDIPFWAHMPFHLECEALEEDHLEQILAYMYRTKRFQALFGEAGFNYKNPGLDASAGERSTLAGVLMRHIAMIRLMGQFVIKGLVHPDCRFPITKFDNDEPEEVSILVNRSVQELMMEKKIHGTKLWIQIAQTQDGCWVSYYRYGVGNESHKKLALEWSGSLSAHIRFHLLGWGFDNAWIKDLIKGSFDYQATIDAAQAVVGKDGQVKSLWPAEVEQVLSNHDKTQQWVDLMLGMMKKQQEEYECQRIAQAKQTEGADQGYDFEEAHSVNPVAGRPDDGTTFTKNENYSLGKTAYDVAMVGSNDSDSDEFAEDLYGDGDKDKGENSMELDIYQVHWDKGHELQEQSLRIEARAETASGDSQTTCANQSNLHEVCSLSTNGSGGGSLGHTGPLLTNLAKASLNTVKVAPEQGQGINQTRDGSLAQAKEWQSVTAMERAPATDADWSAEFLPLFNIDISINA